MLQTLLTLDLTSLLIIAIFFLLLEYRPQWWWNRIGDSAKITKTIPGPKTLPLIGTTWTLFIGKVAHLHLYYQKMYTKYGPIMKEEVFGNIPVINVFEKDDIVKVLKNGGKYPLRPPCEAIVHYRRSRPDRYASVGLVNSQGSLWYHLRMTLTQVFSSPKTISTFLPQVQEISDDWCHLLKKHCGRITDLTEFVDKLSLEITCALVLGRRMGFLLPENQSTTSRNLADAVRQHFISTRDTYFGIPFWKIFPTSSYRKLVKSEEIIYDLAMELIRTADDSTKDSIVFQTILNANVDHREKIAAIIDFIAAGIHTLKNSFLFLLYLIACDSKIQQNIIDDDSKNYVKACLLESFRLLPTANALARILEDEMELANYKVPAGTAVVCHFGIACRNEKNFKDADKFKPERWLNEEKSNNSMFLLVPFGVGRRVCPGKRFIEQILPILLETTVRNFKMIADEEINIEYEFLLTPNKNMSLVFNNR